MRKTIASIYPLPQTADRPLYAGRYELPAVPKGDPPFLLTVDDKVQVDRTLHIMGNQEIRRTVEGEKIAPDLVKQWAENAPGMGQDCGPGIWIVREEVSETLLDASQKPYVVTRAANPEEKNAMFAEDWQRAKDRQAAWFEYQIMAGDRMRDGDIRTPLMKIAARYMGRNRKWLEEMKDGDTATCPYCKETVPAGASVCKFCRGTVDFDAFAALEARKQAALANAGVVEVAEPATVNP